MSSQDKKEGFESIKSSDDIKAWEREIATINKLEKTKIYLKPDEIENGNNKKILGAKKQSPKERADKDKGGVGQNTLTKSSFQTDGRTEQKLKQGRIRIDAKIDLHGKTKAEAYELLTGFIADSYEEGCKCVLVITGKGSKSGGVLKKIVPDWLSQTRFQQYVIKANPAKPKHGGNGALYILLRKKRKN